MSLGAEVVLGPGHIVLDGDPAPRTERGTAAAPTLRLMSIVAKWSPISATAKLLFFEHSEISVNTKWKYVTAEKGIMLLSAGLSSNTLAEINQTIIEGKRLAGNVRILAFGVSSGTLS